MPDLDELSRNTARLTFDYAAATFEAYYRPVEVGASTQAAEAAIRAGDLEPMYAELARLVEAWDATRGGHPVPTTADGFRSAGFGICIALWNALTVDVRNPTMAPLRGPASPTPSSNGSSPTAASAPPASPTTSASSSPPSGSGFLPGTSPASPAALATPAGSPGATA